MLTKKMAKKQLIRKMMKMSKNLKMLKSQQQTPLSLPVILNSMEIKQSSKNIQSNKRTNGSISNTLFKFAKPIILSSF